jgi:hypothetical protein
MMRHLVLLLLLTSIAFAAQQAPPQTSSVSGAVVDAHTHQPIANVRVALFPNRGVETNTDSRGVFTLQGLEAGRQTVSASAPGYEGIRRILTVTSGARVENVNYRLSPRGAVSGRVLNPRGLPAVGASVTLVEYRFDVGSSSAKARPGQANTTVAITTFAGGSVDDQGNFRIYNVSPGEYLVRFTPSTETITTLGTVLYPGVTDLSKATALRVGPGQETRLTTVVLNPSPLGLIRARIVDVTGETRVPGPRGEVFLTAYDSSNKYQVNEPFAADRGRGVEIRPDWQGKHLVCGSFAVIGQGGFELSETTAQRTGCVPVDYTGREIEVEIRVGKPDGRISGRVLLESQSDPSLKPFPGLRISGQTDNPSVNSIGLRSNTDGTLSSRTGTGWLAGLGQLTSFPIDIPGDYYVESVRQGDRDVLREGLLIPSNMEMPMEILVSTAGGILSGKLAAADGKAAPHTSVVLVPRGNITTRSDKGSVYRSVEADQNGVYEFRALVPGEYHAYALSTLNDFAYWDPTFLKGYEAKGKAVRVNKGGKVAADLTVIE